VETSPHFSNVPTVNGILVVDKPSGPTSHDIVLRIRRLFSKTKIGHLGTLDPFATGVLPVCIGKATRLAQFLDQGEKIYQATVQFGRVTDTGDFTGATIAESAVPRLDENILLPLLTRFQSTWMQKTPAFSARKVGGKPMYAYARKGIEVEGRSREITVHEIRLLEMEENSCRLFIRCSPGTYIRAIADEMGQMLGCGGHLSALRRQHSAGFGLEKAMDGQILFHPIQQDMVLPSIVSIDGLLTSLPRMTVREESIVKLKNGLTLLPERDFYMDSSIRLETVYDDPTKPVRLMNADGHLLAIGRPVGDRGNSIAPTEKIPIGIHPHLVLL
jgi:tRNA pseudouridine55 synthase